MRRRAAGIRSNVAHHAGMTRRLSRMEVSAQVTKCLRARTRSSRRLLRGTFHPEFQCSQADVVCTEHGPHAVSNPDSTIAQDATATEKIICIGFRPHCIRGDSASRIGTWLTTSRVFREALRLASRRRCTPQVEHRAPTLAHEILTRKSYSLLQGLQTVAAC